MKVFSVRNINKLQSHDVVYEWEDYAREHFGFDIVFGNKIEKTIGRIARKLFRKKYLYHKGNEPIIFFCMSIHELEISTYFRRDIIPIILDLPAEDIDRYVKACQKLPVFFVTAYETYKIIKNEYHINNIEYIPLFVIDDKYTLSELSEERTIDIVQIGRCNPVLHKFALEYCENHSECNYVYREWAGKEYHYFSTIHGDLGVRISREEYWKLLKNSAISLVSTPSMDGVREFGHKIDFFTPRFFESAAAGCGIVARYPQIDEADIVGIGNMCESVNNYQQFEKKVTELLSMPLDQRLEHDRDFLRNNCSSIRIKEIISILDERLDHINEK